MMPEGHNRKQSSRTRRCANGDVTCPYDIMYHTNNWFVTGTYYTTNFVEFHKQISVQIWFLLKIHIFYCDNPIVPRCSLGERLSSKVSARGTHTTWHGVGRHLKVKVFPANDEYFIISSTEGSNKWYYTQYMNKVWFWYSRYGNSESPCGSAWLKSCQLSIFMTLSYSSE